MKSQTPDQIKVRLQCLIAYTQKLVHVSGKRSGKTHGVNLLLRRIMNLTAIHKRLTLKAWQERNVKE